MRRVYRDGRRVREEASCIIRFGIAFILDSLEMCRITLGGSHSSSISEIKSQAQNLIGGGTASCGVAKRRSSSRIRGEFCAHLQCTFEIRGWIEQRESHIMDYNVEMAEKDMEVKYIP